MESFYGPVVDGDMFPAHPLVMLENPQSIQSLFFKSLDFMAGINSQEGSLLYITTPPQVQKKFDFNMSINIPTNALCQGLVRPLIEQQYGNREDLIDIACKVYTSDGTEDDQSNRAADCYADVIFNVGVAETLNAHAHSSKGRTYQYQVSRLSPRRFGPPAPSWFKGVGHGDEMLYLFHREREDNPAFLNVNYTESDRHFADTVVSFWNSFAKTGVPTAGDSALPWLEYDVEKKIYLDLDDELSLRQNLKREGVKFWTEKMPFPDYKANFGVPHDEL